MMLSRTDSAAIADPAAEALARRQAREEFGLS
jgi:hypothetical protein